MSKVLKFVVGAGSTCNPGLCYNISVYSGDGVSVCDTVMEIIMPWVVSLFDVTVFEVHSLSIDLE